MARSNSIFKCIGTEQLGHFPTVAVSTLAVWALVVKREDNTPLLHLYPILINAHSVYSLIFAFGHRHLSGLNAQNRKLEAVFSVNNSGHDCSLSTSSPYELFSRVYLEA